MQTQAQTRTATLTATDLVTGEQVPTRKREVLRAPVGGDAVKAARAAAKAAVAEMWKAYSSKSNAQKAAKKLDVARVEARGGQWGVVTVEPVSEAEVDEVPPKQLAEPAAPVAVVVEVAAPAAKPAPAPKAAPLPSTGWTRHTRRDVEVLAALTAGAPGLTLAELTELAEWRMPYEVRNLRILAGKKGLAVKHDAALDVRARRYWLGAA